MNKPRFALFALVCLLAVLCLPGGALAAAAVAAAGAEAAGKKISLKIMTLNNNRQKINDCLGNPVEIGIAVMWRVTDTAKAVFNVDNYMEYRLHTVPAADIF